ncbi:MAG: hypothetical protein ABIF82_09955 [Planctomycetota bacterium]
MAKKKPEAAAVQEAKTTAQKELVRIPPPNIGTASFSIRGVAPLVMHKFSAKAKRKMMETQERGSQKAKGTKREARDFDGEWQDAIHRDEDGFAGIPASAFRAAAISACRLAGFKMTVAKLSLFVCADGFDREDGMPLVRITKGKPSRVDSTVRLESGVCSVVARPMWAPGWEAKVRVRYDADQFSLSDVANLLHRVGSQVGILEGRPDSRQSAGMGWGLFELAGDVAAD